MSLILVVESESRSVERIRDALQADGFSVEAVSEVDVALRSVAAQAPGLLLVNHEIAEASSLVRRFSRRAGGPGTIALLSEMEAGATAESLGADEVISKPFTDQQLRLAVRRLLATARQVPAHAAAAAAADSRPLTSQDIFADVLAEVESEIAKPTPTPPPAPVAAAPDRLERALAGARDGDREKKSAAAASRADDRSKIDDLLSKTLSGLEVGDRIRKPAAKPAAPVAKPTPAAPPAAATAPPPAAPAAAAFASTVSIPIVPEKPPAPAPVFEPPPTLAPPPVVATTLPLVGTTTPIVAPAPPSPPFAALPPDTAPVAPPAPAVEPAAAPVPPVVARPPAQPAAPAAPARERTAARRPTGEIDLAALDELARPKTRTGAAPPRADKTRDTAAFATQRIEVQKPAAAKTDSREFGQYTLLDKIAVGGMAEVWKARMKGVEGFQKTVAIKKILAHLTDSSDFVTMFIDEAKLAAQLNHNNIIHIYDLGKLGDDYFIAMEFVEGKDLRSILNNARQQNLAMPMGLALLVAARLASALDYAHRKKDFEGRELGLVHRDVSPQNVLIGYEGDIKLCDFGIVKAVSKASKTQMGALKGKLQYMSPEQAWGRTVDSRSDIFSLGALLFEMLTGRRLFAGDSEMSVLESVRDCRISAPRDLDAKIPLEVNGLVLKSLSREPADRFQTAGEMQKEIEKILYSLKPTPGQADLAAYMHRLFGPEARGQETLTATTAPLAPAPPAPAPALMPAAPAPAAAPRAEFPAMAPIGETTAVSEGGSKAVLWGAIAAVVVLGIAGALYFGRSKAPAVPPPAAPVESAPAPATGAERPAPETAAKPVDLAGMVDQQVKKKEEEMRQQKEAELKKLQGELAKTQAGATPAAPAPTPAATTPPPATTAPSAPPAPADNLPAPVAETPASAPAPAPAAVEPEPQPVAPTPAPAANVPALHEGDLVSAGPGVVPPVLVSFNKPEYPPLARRLQVQGVVTVGMLVDENGNVVETRIVKPSARNVGLDEAAERSARSAKFKPATKNGVRVKMWHQLNIPFKM